MKKQFLAFLLSFLSLGLMAQTLKGKVINEISQPIEGVYVFNLNSEKHAHTTENGQIILAETKIGDSIKLGLLGYKSKTLKVESLDKITIVLQEKTFQLEEMVLTEELNTVSTISRLDLSINPVNSSQEILQRVPGLFIGQHAGGGKAEQLFLRGFDVDHGTDVSITVDGMPVNMVSHAHGQGYSDLHFIIPETINKIDFGKGSYYAGKGDFNTAGYVDFSTKDYLKESSVTFSLGDFNTLRTIGLFDLLKNVKNKNAYLAVEYLESDGPFESPQNFTRLNLMGKYVLFTPEDDKITLSASHFTSRWDASGQIPLREVDNGNITRFGAIDDTEGGFTERSNFNIAYNKYINDNTRFNANVFYSRYAFELYSNFTFFLEDPVNGDQIRQKEDRSILGLNTDIQYTKFLGDTEFNLNGGLSFRHDIINDIELSRTLNRTTTLENIQLGDINQTNVSAFVNTSFEFGKLRVDPGVRLDYFKFLYNDQLQTNYETQSQTKSILSPKLNFYFDADDNLQLYLKTGTGFHSNDARVVLANEADDILPRSYNADLGGVWKPTPDLVVKSALWYLFLEQEFVYVGDAGVVEPSGETERYGLDFGLRYQFSDWFFLDADATLTEARSVNEPEGNDYIPLAPDFTLAGGLSVNNYKGFSGGLRFRYLDDRPANEDNNIVAEGYFVTDFNVNYQLKDLTFGISINNLFDVDWNETQFATESRLQNEAQSVEEIHFTPGTPFFIKGMVSYRF
ncbi:TonB-dependent receptor [Winogradskyella vincentii]|uniref:TonB-dependent receptor plug domain-containing protein n=1 Tax=Winogradskyella vincentii TaxID=2877122 RepID=A0ABS7Y0M3_9FLAO|nr:TonB-dependent receptor [Winogradskyella vincentii]MCA0153474.1 TonB-dependent receptor plug domain-containing protein [Winogradskyella vincentii]